MSNCGSNHRGIPETVFNQSRGDPMSNCDSSHRGIPEISLGLAIHGGTPWTNRASHDATNGRRMVSGSATLTCSPSADSQVFVNRRSLSQSGLSQNGYEIKSQESVTISYSVEMTPGCCWAFNSAQVLKTPGAERASPHRWRQCSSGNVASYNRKAGFYPDHTGLQLGGPHRWRHLSKFQLQP